jgi:hypothetical protein
VRGFNLLCLFKCSLTGPIYPSNSVFLADVFSSHFELTNMTSTYTEKFSREKMTQIHQILNFKNSKLRKSYDNFQKVNKNIKGFFYFFLNFLHSYLLCNEIWLHYFPDDYHFGYITKSLKETLHSKSSSYFCKSTNTGVSCVGDYIIGTQLHMYSPLFL